MPTKSCLSPGEGGTSYNGLYRGESPEKGTSFRPEIY